MTTLQPRPPYTPDELARLYPETLQLQQVQIILRHGERTPVSARFQNVGLPAYWPYCTAASRLRHNIMTADSWDVLTWKRRLETFERQTGSADSDKPATIAALEGKGGIDSICNSGELTDRGRETTLALGQRLRQLYVDRLNFLPRQLESTDYIRLRATPIPRALESTQQAFTGLYPRTAWSGDVLPPAITQRSMSDETLFPNETYCKRFNELARAFANRAAMLWNDSPEMQYINNRLRKHMPDGSAIKVDSHPRLSGIMDTINSTLAHGKDTKLPPEFYDQTVVSNIDKICTEEWFMGYMESNEYRKLGIGAMVGDVVQNMVESATNTGRGSEFKISLSGCHDTTIAATVASLGVYDAGVEKWPPYTSSIAIELFKRRTTKPSNKMWWSSFFPTARLTDSRKSVAEMSAVERRALDEYYVRLRYNDKTMTLPYCKARADRHFEGDEGLCTLQAFKEAADSFTPKDWKSECALNLGQPAERPVIERPPGLEYH